MSPHETLARKEAERRGWKIERRDLELGVVGVPCFLAPDRVGRCEVWVGVASDSDAVLHASQEWQQGALHAARITGFSGGLYNRAGAKFSPTPAAAIAETSTSMVISGKLLDDNDRRRDYEDAWEALNTYVIIVYGAFLGNAGPVDSAVARPYTFDVLGDQSPEAVEWRSRLAKDNVAIIGLGGVGAWIGDFVVKSDPQEVHAWDDDCTEPKNILRVPGGSEPTKWIGKPKVEWFEETYSRVHRNVHGHEAKVKPGNMEEVFDGVTFAFVAVDEDDDRAAICEFLAAKGVPCVVAGISLAREEKQVIIEMRIVTGHPDASSWQKAVPQLGKAGQDDYGSLDLPDVYSMAASWAVQSWRKMRGQVLHARREECLTYYADDQQLILEGL